MQATRDFYQKRASALTTLAAQAKSKDHRSDLLTLAQAWRDLASGWEVDQVPASATCGEKKAPPKQAKKSRRPIKKGRAARTAPGSPRTAAEAVVLVIPAHVAADQEKAAMAHIVDFLQSQPPDVYRVVLNAIEPLWLEPKADAAVRQAIKQRFPGRFSDDEIGSLIHGAMFIMK